MPLVDLKTNLKSLRYGNDRPFGGSSKQPYIQTPIPENPDQVGNPQGIDYLLRNGSLYVETANQDTSRILKLLTDTDSQIGENWRSKQKQLSSQSTWRFPLSLPVSQIYNQKQTLDQVEFKAGQLGINGPWYHIYKQGGLSLPSLGYLNPANYGNAYKLADQAGVNRLTNLYRSKISVFGGEGAAILGAANSVLLGVAPGNTNIPGTDLFLQAYYGGTDNYGTPVSVIPRTTFSTNKAKSFSGLGTTRIARLINNALGNEGQSVITFDQDILGTLSLNNTSNLTPLQILDRNISSILSPTTFIYGPNAVIDYQDFRQTIKENPNTKDFSSGLASTNYRVFNRQTKYKTGNPGVKTANRSNPYQSIPNSGSISSTADEQNLVPLYTNTSVDNEVEQSDLIKFTISVVNNDDPSQRTWIHFRAFIDSFGDSFNANWNEYKYVGRAESFYRYGGFSRGISLSFKAAVQSRQEQLPLYQKLNYLASLTAPDYTQNGFMRGNLIYLTVGDWLVDVPGVLKGMSLGIPNESPWEIARDAEGNIQNDIAQLPFVVEVSGFDFAPIHNFVPRTNAPFIGAPILGSKSNYFIASPRTTPQNPPSGPLLPTTPPLLNFNL
jgi:hypothetical protein